MARYRIEAVQPGVKALALQYGVAYVNGVPFRSVEGRAISDVVGDEQIRGFANPGYLLVREDAPYEVVASLNPADKLRVSTEAKPSSDESAANPEETPTAIPNPKKKRG